MSEENKEVVTPPENNTELEQLKESVKKLEAKNYELIGKLKNQKPSSEKQVPEDYEELLAFKQKREQEDLEKEGKYEESKSLLDKVKSGTAKASDLNVARQFLRDNGIAGVPVENSPLKNLMDELPFTEEEVVKKFNGTSST